ncbi:MAG: cytochrome P450 [Pseudonocardiaceae bacterium]
MTDAIREIDLLSWEFIQNPYSVYRDMREENSVRRLTIKTLGTRLRAWLVTEYEDARRLLADPRLSKNTRELPRIINLHKVDEEDVQFANSASMLFSDPPDHTRLRRTFGKAFTMRRVESMRPWIEQVTRTVLDTITPGVEIDLVDTVAMAIPISVIGNLLGVPREYHDQLRRWNKTLTGADSSPAEKYHAYTAALEYIKTLIVEKRAARDQDDDMITVLLNLERDDALTDEEVISTVFLVMNAGYETTANLIGSAVYTLLRHPDQQDLLRADPLLLPTAIEEFLRYESPLNLSTVRYTVEPVTVRGTVIPADAVVFIALCSANRDPARFDEPDRLDVQRGSNGHLSFGHGIHHCVGAPLARMEGKIVLRELLDRFPRWEPTESLEGLPWRYSLQLRGLQRLPMRLYEQRDYREERNVSDDVISRFFTTSRARDVEAAADCFAEDGVWISADGSEPGTLYRKNEIGELMVEMNKYRDQLLSQGMDGYFDPPIMFGNDEAVVRWTVKTSDGKIVQRGVDLFVVRDDKIVLKDVYRKV